MPQNLVDYIRQQLAQGYAITQIRQTLINYGYPAYQVDQAISETYGAQPQTQQPIQPLPSQTPQITHKTSLPKGLVIIILLLAVSGLTFFSYDKFIKPKVTPETLLDVSLEAISTTAQPGENIIFIANYQSMGTKKRYDVSIMHSIIDKNNNIAYTKEDTLAIETSMAKRTSISLPDEIKPGKYTLKTVAKYNGRTATATIPVKVYQESEEEATCFDNVKNQGEQDIDCGGPCDVCRVCPTSCDDQDPCTEDYCSSETNQICRHTEISDCRLSETEQQTTIETPPEEEIPLEEIRSQLNEVIQTQPDQAAQLCGQLTDTIEKDNCFNTIVELSGESHYCQYIERETTKDSCYFNIIMKTNDVELCEELTTAHFRRSCESFKNVQAIYESIETPPEQDYSGIDPLKQAVLEGKTADELLAMLGITQPNINHYNMIDQFIIGVQEGKSNEELTQIIS